MTENKVTIVMYHFVRDEPLIGKKSIHAWYFKTIKVPMASTKGNVA